ncbi:MAG: amidohydrolase family protein [Lachnospiraceae bacterium]|nr:amidohydrolase family protein [Lachnospiraceae bacterium]
MLAVKNAELIMHDHLIPNAVLFAENGKITGFGEMKNHPIPEDCEVYDAEGAYVGPGFIDIHTHAAGGKMFGENPSQAAKSTLSHGTTSVFAALYYNADLPDLLRQIKAIRKSMHEEADGKNIAGIYMEGPYLNPKFGGNKENNPWAGPIRKEDYEKLINALGDDVFVWCIAPERDKIIEFVKAAKAAKPEVRFAVAHSEASPEEIEALMPYGLCIGTHHTNATGTRPKPDPEVRGVCVDECVNYHHEIYAEQIVDSMGCHVDPYMQRLVRQIKGNDRIILISDAFVDDGPVPPEYEDAVDISFDQTGEIAGSRLTLDIACRNYMKHTGASIVDVFNCASYNPAKALGLTDRGEIAVGKRADLVVCDYKVNVQKVIFEGEVLK